MRLFLAADLGEGARAAVAGAVARFRAQSELERPGSTRGVTWVEPRNLHLTLHFLGEVDEARLPSLRDALAPALGLDPPRIGLAEWGVFPERGPARVIWIGVSEGTDALASSHDVLGQRLRAIGITPESRPFSPHLTVGRVKVPSGPHWSRLVGGVPSAPVCEWRLNACTLFQSHLSPAGPTYRALLSIPLAGAPRGESVDTPEADHAQ